jgi:hypothetical protein
MTRRWFRITAWLPLVLIAPLLHADTRPGLTVHETELRGEPSASASSVATLPSGAQLTVFERKGGWYRVEADTGAGWLRLASIRFPNTAQQQAEGGAATMMSMMRIGPGADVDDGPRSTTTGVRGLDGASIDNAAPDEEQIAKLEALARTAETGRALAEEGKLAPVDVDFLEMAELDETLLDQTRSARTEEELRGPERKVEDCYGDTCDSDIPYLGGD